MTTENATNKSTQASTEIVCAKTKAEAIRDEIKQEFIISNDEAYKTGLRSIAHQRQRYERDMATLRNDMQQLDKAEAALTTAYINGEIKTVEDVKGITRVVGK